MDQGCPAVGKGMSGTSKQVKIFTTPGICSAWAVSTERTIPWAMVEWTIRVTSAERSQRSSVYLARPVALSKASTRSLLFPTLLIYISLLSFFDSTLDRREKIFPSVRGIFVIIAQGFGDVQEKILFCMEIHFMRKKDFPGPPMEDLTNRVPLTILYLKKAWKGSSTLAADAQRGAGW